MLILRDRIIFLYHGRDTPTRGADPTHGPSHRSRHEGRATPSSRRGGGGRPQRPAPAHERGSNCRTRRRAVEPPSQRPPKAIWAGWFEGRWRAHLVESSKSSREHEDEEGPSVWESDESARLPAPLSEVMLPPHDAGRKSLTDALCVELPREQAHCPLPRELAAGSSWSRQASSERRCSNSGSLACGQGQAGA